MRITLTPAFVLHRRPYSETSLVVELFSRDLGRVGVLAKGARRQKSKWTATLEPFTRLEASWRGRGELPTLTAAEPMPGVDRLAGRSIMAGLYLNELLMRLTARHDAHPELFEHYAFALTALLGPDGEEPALRLFEKHLLDAIGYGVVTHADANTGESVLEDQRYYYVREHGPSKTAQAGCKISGGTLLALAAEEFSHPQHLAEAKLLMRFLLAPLLGDKPLHTRALYRPG